MSEQPGSDPSRLGSEALRAGATSQEFGNLSVEDDPAGTVNPADLAGTAEPDEEPDGEPDGAAGE